MRNGCPERRGAEPSPCGGVLKHPDDASRALVAGALEAQRAGDGVVGGRDRHRYRTRVGHVGQQCSERDDAFDAELRCQAEQLGTEGPPPDVRLDAPDQDNVAARALRPGKRDTGSGPVQASHARLVHGDGRTVDLEVVVLLGVELGEGDGLPRHLEVLDDRGRRLARVVPSLERGHQDGVVQLGNAVELRHPCLLASKAMSVSVRPYAARQAPSQQPDIVTGDRSGPTSLNGVSASAGALRQALSERVVVADGAMGTMLQAANLTLDDFEGHEGCNEILNATRPDVVRGIHEAYLAVGVDCVETNTFGANWANLGEYGIAGRIHELSESGARLARQVADGWATPDRPRWVLGSVGPGTKLPSLGHVPFAVLRDAYRRQVEGMIAGGVHAVLVETSQDLLQAKAALIGARRAMTAAGADLPLLVNVTVETTGTMLLGTEIGAALTALEPLGVDFVGLNCATGPAEMSEHLRHLARHASAGIACMPNAGLPQLTADGAHYPLTAGQLADAHDLFTAEYGLALVGGCCGTTPEHLRQVVERVGGRDLAPRRPLGEAGVASLYQHVPFQQDTSYLAIGERTNANGSRAFRDAMLDERWDDCVEIARSQTRDGSHLLDVCVDYVGRDGAADMREIAGRFATASTLPLVIDSTEPAVVEAGLECLGGRSVINSVNYEDGDGPDSRFAKVTRLAVEHGAALIALTIDEEGQARTAERKVAVAERLIADLTGNWGVREADIIIDCLTFTIATGQEESRRDGVATIEAIRELKRRHPDVQTTLGLSNISFGLNPAARSVLNSAFLHECVKAGLDSAIVHASKILPIARFTEEEVQTALDLIYDRRAEGYDPLQKLMQLFEGATAKSLKAGRAEELAALPLDERLQRRIIDGERNGLEADLDAALAERPALDIVNDTLLAGMKVVGELFGSGQMQLPFVLQSAEVMKAAVRFLEPFMEKKGGATAKGTMVLATVKGDVHDIGKNLVDIILTNNGYKVHNLGIKQPIEAILQAYNDTGADAIGMSGLLVKSTLIMKDNLELMNERGVKVPVVLGGAALTRRYVEDDLKSIYAGSLFYARDAFAGLHTMDLLVGDNGHEHKEKSGDAA